MIRPHQPLAFPVLVVLLALPACGHLKRWEYGDDGPGFARKEVTGKVPPGDLRAMDGTRCTVSTKRFAEVKAGDVVWCAWAPARDPSDPQAGQP